MKTKTKIEYVVEVNPIGEFRTARSCAVCGDPASREVMRAVKGHPWILATLRFSCARHANLKDLYPVRVQVKLDPLPQRRRTWTPLIRGGDHSMFYRDVMREMGGKVPMPDRETKEEIADAESTLKRRAKNWLGPVEVPQRKDVKMYSRRYRIAGMSGRQWVRFRKITGLARTAR